MDLKATRKHIILNHMDQIAKTHPLTFPRCILQVTNLFTRFIHLFHVSRSNVGFEKVFCVLSCKWQTVHKRMRFGSMGKHLS
jgi:hypothetical protein